jgi:hypothetical protein
MHETPDLDRIRKESLDRAERSERNYRLAFAGAAAVEAAFVLGFLALADFSDRLHVLLLLSTVAVYTLVALGLVAVGAHVSRNTQLVLRAVALLGDEDGARR